MKPIKALYPVSIWLMRIGLLLFAYGVYFDAFISFKLDAIQFYVSAIFIIAAVIIFISGFLSKEKFVVFSGFSITLVSVFNIIDTLDSGLDSALIINIIIASIAMFFISRPTRK
jgi:hypothetical protein